MNPKPKEMSVAKPRSDTQAKFKRGVEIGKFMKLKALEIRFIGDLTYLLSICPLRHFLTQMCAQYRF